MGKTVNISINGSPVKIEKGKTILDAADGIGIKIPTLCYHKDRREAGNCRVCVVEVVGHTYGCSQCRLYQMLP